MKRNYTITLDDGVWQKLEDMASEQGLAYRGRLSRAAVIEQLVRGVPVAVQPAAAQPAPAQPAPVDATAAAQPSYRLADIVERWPAKVQERWQQDGWKAKTWVQLVLDTINGEDR